ncbi:MAG: hypothetical protein ACI4MB_05790 [Candidatus Coproplasma sp.]
MAKSKSAKIIAGALALVACSVSLLGCTSKDNGFHWADNNSNITADNYEHNAIVNDVENNGMLMVSKAIPLNSYEEYDVSALALNAYSLSVTYTPSSTTRQETTYSIAFKDGSSCSSYATISQSSAGSKTATLTILKPFTKQIIVTATCNANTAIKATTTVDYVCDTLNITLPNQSVYVDDDISFVYNGWSNGTLTPSNDKTITFVYKVEPYFVYKATAAGFTVKEYYTQTLSAAQLAVGMSFEVSGITSIYPAILISGNSTSYNTFMYSYFSTYVSDGDSCGMYAFSYNRIYNGVTYSTYDVTQDSSAEWYDYDRGVGWEDYFS